MPLDILRKLEAQVVAQPVDETGTIRFLKDGVLVVIRAGITAAKALREKRHKPIER
jgi:hypothetical protein